MNALQTAYHDVVLHQLPVHCAVYGQLNCSHRQDPMRSFSLNPATEGCLQYPSTSTKIETIFKAKILP